MIPKPALADWQKRARDECSSLRYHVPIMRMNPGEMVHSKKPWRARMAISWAQFWAAETVITQTPIFARQRQITKNYCGSYPSRACKYWVFVPEPISGEGSWMETRRKDMPGRSCEGDLLVWFYSSGADWYIHCSEPLILLPFQMRICSKTKKLNGTSSETWRPP